jgi:RIO-like serine/threonine protein kinase
VIAPSHAARLSWWRPHIRVLRTDAGDRILKSFAPSPGPVRWTYGRWSTAHEASVYERLRDVRGVPRARRTGAYELTISRVEGRELREYLRTRNRRALPAGFFRRLRGLLRRLHARGVYHLDLRHRTNILIDEAGRPHIIDFTSSVRLRPGSPLSRWLAPILRRIDLLAVLKHERRLRPNSRSGAERRGIGFRALAGRLWNGS